MATARVTKRSVDNLKGGEGTSYLWDDELRGFGVRITDTGVKSYVYQYRLGGRKTSKKRVTIGRHGSPWTPETARAEAKRLALAVGQGFDPIERERQGLVLSTTGNTAPSGYSKAKSRLDGLVSKRMIGKNVQIDCEVVPSIPEWRIHDIRRTVATGLQRIGIRFEVTESILNHVSGARSGVAGIYQRHDWKEEKRKALNAWAEHVSSITA